VQEAAVKASFQKKPPALAGGVVTAHKATSLLSLSAVRSISSFSELGAAFTDSDQSLPLIKP
jgi:hypothetical protein